MPRVTPELDAVLIPAGSLDTEPPVSPQGRIFYDSRAAWSCSDELQVYSEYPPDAWELHRINTRYGRYLTIQEKNTGTEAQR